MDDRERSQLNRGIFQQVAAGYDHPALRFFALTAEAMLGTMALTGGEQVLDVAAGTGHTALPLARRLPRGRVTAIDISPAMLAVAAAKARAAGLHNIEFREMNMLDLAFPDGRFDHAVCSYGIFFVEDMLGLLCRIAAKLKPGGSLVVSTFADAPFTPLAGLLAERLAQYGLPAPPAPSKRVASPEQCRSLFADAGFAEIAVDTKPLGYYLPTPEDWWSLIMGSAFRARIARLPPEQVDDFRRAHLAEVARLATGDGIWLEVSAIITRGVVP
jgi:ubiquinone/menaquinone biosynthesis C-methylase UbiE